MRFALVVTIAPRVTGPAHAADVPPYASHSLVDAAAGLVRGWDDPRLFTLPALRRRGFPAAAIHAFTSKVGVTEAQATLEPHLLESCVRDVLNTTAVRVMAVLDPVKVTVTNASSGADVSSLEVPNNPVDETMGVHSVPFSSVFYIDRCDFMEVPEKGWLSLNKPAAAASPGPVAASPVRHDHLAAWDDTTARASFSDGQPASRPPRPIPPLNSPRWHARFLGRLQASGASRRNSPLG